MKFLALASTPSLWLSSTRTTGFDDVHTIVIPLSYAVAQMLGQTLLETNLDFALDPFGFVIWLGVVVTFSIIASLLPAWNASRLTTNGAN